MGRPRKHPPGKTSNLGTRLPTSLIEEVDQEAGRIAAAMKLQSISRTQAIEILLREALEARHAKRNS